MKHTSINQIELGLLDSYLLDPATPCEGQTSSCKGKCLCEDRPSQAEVIQAGWGHVVFLQVSGSQSAVRRPKHQLQPGTWQECQFPGPSPDLADLTPWGGAQQSALSPALRATWRQCLRPQLLVPWQRAHMSTRSPPPTHRHSYTQTCASRFPLQPRSWEVQAPAVKETLPSSGV